VSDNNPVYLTGPLTLPLDVRIVATTYGTYDCIVIFDWVTADDTLIAIGAASHQYLPTINHLSITSGMTRNILLESSTDGEGCVRPETVIYGQYGDFTLPKIQDPPLACVGQLKVSWFGEQSPCTFDALEIQVVELVEDGWTRLTDCPCV